MLEMMADAAGLRHAGGGDDHARPPVEVDLPGLVSADAQLQPLETQRVFAAADQRAHLFIEVVIRTGVEYFSRFNGQGAVHKHREILVAADQSLSLDLPQEVEDLLRASYGKGGDDHLAAPVEGGLQGVGQIRDIVRPLAVQAVTVGGFHHHIIRRA